MSVLIYIHRRVRARACAVFICGAWMKGRCAAYIYARMHSRGQFRDYARGAVRWRWRRRWRWLLRQTVSSIGIAGIACRTSGVRELSATIYMRVTIRVPHRPSGVSWSRIDKGDFSFPLNEEDWEECVLKIKRLARSRDDRSDVRATVWFTECSDWRYIGVQISDLDERALAALFIRINLCI